MVDDTPVLMACVECTNRVETTYASLREAVPLTCPACGRAMADECAAVLQHIDSIRRATSF